MPTTCEIEFNNNPSKEFRSGQHLQGVVRLTVTNEKVIQKACINIVGAGYVRWTDRESRLRYDAGRRRTVTEYHTVVRSSSEIYLNATSYFISDVPPLTDSVRLTPGTYSYPFEHTLPLDLPTSFVGKHGHITYKVVAVFDARSDWFDKRFEEPFTVIKGVDLNLDPRLREPVTATDVNTFYPCCLLCCWESDPLEVTAKIPFGGYVQGQTIKLNILVCNKSDTAVEDFKAQLIRNVTYYANGHKNSEENIVVETSARGCDVYQNKNYQVPIKVPSTSPSEVTNIIKIQYRLRVFGSVSGCHNNPIVVLPIIIGIFPILDIQEQQPTSVSPTVPPLPIPSAPIQFPSDEPPKYEETIQIGEQSDEKFTSKYPTFKSQT